MIQEFQLRLLPEQASSEQAIKQFLHTDKGLNAETINHVRILKRSIDARQRIIYVNLKVRAYIGEEPTDSEYIHTDYPNVEGHPEAIVIGAGPGGLFAALRLIELGIRPIVIERGKDVHERRKDIALISREHTVNPESNYSFGEGGAGAFSDGKLYTRSKKRGNTDRILNIFCQHGASTSILIDAHPHIGTDRLPRVIENMRSTIIRCGGEVHFQTRMTGLIIKDDTVVGIETVSTADTASSSFTREWIPSPSAKGCPVILATGHSARDVYRWLHSQHIEIESKDIAVGVRLEHPAHLIDQIQYHRREGKGKYLPTAEYSFVTQVAGRGVYSFCMCPGGTVVPAASGPEQVVVNGMSASLRNSPWSNSGMVVQLKTEDITPDPDPLAMLRFQENLEHQCWIQGGRTQTAPAQRMTDFVSRRLSSNLPKSSYQPGLITSPLHFWMPEFITTRLREGFQTFGRTSRGFLTSEALMIGVETRTSAPVRIIRDASTLQHVRIQGLFPCGEGAGYAGGIVSAGIDGERCAEMVSEYLR